MTDEEENAQRVDEHDVAEGELTKIAEDESLSSLTQLRVWDLIRQLAEEKAELLRLHQG